ncbi:MAG: porin family protein [Cyclobacteriaceae bacterium]|nr:porin family protein [Cyclobacteriaceae bacterium]
MKRTSVVLLFLSFVSIAVWAQTNQGNFVVGGSIGFGSTKVSDAESTSNNFSFSPQAGYFIADGMEVGLLLGFSTSGGKINGNDVTKYTNTSVGPYFKYYMFTSNENFAFTLRAATQFGFRKQDPPIGNDIKGSSFGFTVSPGFTYFFTDKIGLDFQLAGIGIHTTKPNKEVDSTTTTFTFGVDSFSPSLGFRYFFTR